MRLGPSHLRSLEILGRIKRKFWAKASTGSSRAFCCVTVNGAEVDRGRALKRHRETDVLFWEFGGLSIPTNLPTPKKRNLPCWRKIFFIKTS